MQKGSCSSSDGTLTASRQGHKRLPHRHVLDVHARLCGATVVPCAPATGKAACLLYCIYDACSALLCGKGKCCPPASMGTAIFMA